jgi:hypothetical protein
LEAVSIQKGIVTVSALKNGHIFTRLCGSKEYENNINQKLSTGRTKPNSDLSNMYAFTISLVLYPNSGLPK